MTDSVSGTGSPPVDDRRLFVGSCVIFGTLYMRDRRGGGYVVERIGA